MSAVAPPPSLPSGQAPESRNAAPSPAAAAAARKRMIEERQRRSVLWRLIHMLGSLKLALLLISTIAIACAVATFYEAGFNAKIAQHYIYKAPWFIFWLGILCINLFAVTLTRWPWEKKHTGFIVTHYGIILLLIGAVIGSRYGFEGNVTLHTDHAPTNRITTSQSIVQIEDPNSPALLVKPFDASVHRISEERPRRLPVPGTDWQIVVTEFTPDMVTETVLAQPAVGDVAGSPGAVLSFSSPVAPQPQRMVLLAGGTGPSTESLSGMANVFLLPEWPELESKKIEERQMVFARFQPVSEGEPTNTTILLARDGATVRIVAPDGTSTLYRLAEVLGRTVQAGSAVVEFREYWPDFELVDGKPTSKSDKPNNPAVLASITLEKNLPSGTLPEGANRGLAMLASVDPSTNALRYRMLRNGSVEREGAAAVGESIPTGWNDWIAKVEDLSSSAVAQEIVRPAREEAPAEKTGIPGFRAHLQNAAGERGEERWVQSGRITTLAIGHEFLRMGYGLQLQPVPFSIRLVRFDVPRFEGTQTPSNFIATVEFRDTATGETRQDIARMNRPASWPGGLWPIINGLNYKFSQAEWNPQDLNETTLQVLYDPGWMLKWMGSLAICAGIFIMFYWKPRKKTNQ